MTHPVILTDRDRAILRLLSWTPATTVLLLRASSTFAGGPFPDERRLRERLQALAQAGFLRSWGAVPTGGGLQNYYKLTPAGFQALHGSDIELPPRAFLAEIAPSFFEHTLQLAEVIVETVRAAHMSHVVINRFHRENDLTFTVGDEQVQPDCFFGFTAGHKQFHCAFEIDLSTETVDSPSFKSIRRKLLTYDAYQTLLLAQWHENGKAWQRPRFRVAFFTRSIERAYHILAVAKRVAVFKSRRLIYAATLDSFLRATDPLRTPIFIDHYGHWHALVELHPSARATFEPVRLPSSVEQLLPL